MYLGLCKALDTVLHGVLMSELEKHGFHGWTTWGIRNLLAGCTQKSCGQYLDVQVEASDEWGVWASSLCLALFHIFAGDMDNGIEYSLI